MGPGGFVLFRLHVLITLSACCAGCASGPLAPHLTLAPPQETGSVEEDGGSHEKTLAAKVLAAMALERTTGRAPDPARLGELN